MTVSDHPLRERLEPATGEWRTRETLRDSAVLIVLVRRDGRDHLVFQQRRDDLPAHAGQISFPGGARDEGEDAVACALRETQEEIGVPPEAVTLLGRLPDRVSILGYLVAVFVGRLDRPRPYAAEAAEVVEVFEIPYRAMLEEPRWSFREISHPLAQVLRVPYFDFEGRTVWGLTGIILRDFLRAANGSAPGGA